MQKKNIDHTLAINNAWKLSDQWDELIYPEDFPKSALPNSCNNSKKLTSADTYVSAQNHYGGFVYAGGTMAFTAGYYTLFTYRPKTIVFLGCDMVYPQEGNTHFYGIGTQDPLRKDVTLQSLEAKSCRLMYYAAKQGCALVNISKGESRLVFPKVTMGDLTNEQKLQKLNLDLVEEILKLEKDLNYFIPSGEYWKHQHTFDKEKLWEIDQLWLKVADLN
jgi:hypothetical protein